VAQSRSSPHQAVVAAVAADGNGGDSLDHQQQQQSDAAAATPATAAPPPPAAAAAEGASKPAATAAGGKAQPGSGRAPPTRVEAPDLPADLAVFSNAVLLVDKPKEWTSFDACNAIKGAVKRMGVSKVCIMLLFVCVHQHPELLDCPHHQEREKGFAGAACIAICNALASGAYASPGSRIACTCTAAHVALVCTASVFSGWPCRHPGPRSNWTPHHLHRYTHLPLLLTLDSVRCLSVIFTTNLAWACCIPSTCSSL
jgi:hypothetical protein